MSMYAKLFSRITESSLMEEPINVRYTFVMLLAIADPQGYVIGTDVAICRRLNMALAEFQQCLAVLLEPDPHSNSKEHDGRRVVESDGERGYRLVNYLTYRQMKDQQERREYMREYMQKRRGKQDVNSCKQPLAKLTQGEGEEEGEDTPTRVDGFSEFWKAYPKKLAKTSAEKAWKKQKCDAKVGVILAALAVWKKTPDWTKDGGQYVPYPASWLNGQRWEDEIAASSALPGIKPLPSVEEVMAANR
jgi:hypothetical protein